MSVVPLVALGTLVFTFVNFLRYFVARNWSAVADADNRVALPSVPSVVLIDLADPSLSIIMTQYRGPRTSHRRLGRLYDARGSISLTVGSRVDRASQSPRRRRPGSAANPEATTIRRHLPSTQHRRQCQRRPNPDHPVPFEF
jgi:hypothetical protein